MPGVIVTQERSSLPIRIGARSNIQDLACVHLTEGLSQTIVGADVTVGHGAILHGCVIAPITTSRPGATARTPHPRSFISSNTP